MLLIFIGFFSIACAWRWGDWRHWHRYLPTIQYLIMGDMLYNLLCQHFLMWSYPSPPNLFPSHLFNNLFIMFTIYPSTMLLFLYRFPKANISKKILYIVFWICLWLVYELIMDIRGLLIYDNHWSYSASVCFVIIMVPMLYLHFKRPGLAYLVSVPIIVALLIYFHVPLP